MIDALAPQPPTEPTIETPARARRPWERRVSAIALAVAVLALSARVSVPVPGSTVPQSLQTLAVVLVGAWLGAARGALAVAAYLLVGALGVPVFADGAAGAAHLVGPTAGYLIGFVLAAMIVGWAAARAAGGIAGASAVLLWMALGHALILALGWLRLSYQIGASEALRAGVLPFLWGGAAKSVAGALFWYVGSLRRLGPSTTMLAELAPDRVTEHRGGDGRE